MDGSDEKAPLTHICLIIWLTTVTDLMTSPLSQSTGQLVDGRISLVILILADEFRILLLLMTAHPSQDNDLVLIRHSAPAALHIPPFHPQYERLPLFVIAKAFDGCLLGSIYQWKKWKQGCGNEAVFSDFRANPNPRIAYWAWWFIFA